MEREYQRIKGSAADDEQSRQQASMMTMMAWQETGPKMWHHGIAGDRRSRNESSHRGGRGEGTAGTSSIHPSIHQPHVFSSAHVLSLQVHIDQLQQMLQTNQRDWVKKLTVETLPFFPYIYKYILPHLCSSGQGRDHSDGGGKDEGAGTGDDQHLQSQVDPGLQGKEEGGRNIVR